LITRTRLSLPAALLIAVPVACFGGRAAAQSALPRLSGTVIGNGERHAIFVRPDGSSESLAEGEQFDEYEVVRIIPRAVWIRSASGTFALGLTEDDGFRSSTARRPPPQFMTDAERQADEDNNR